MAQTGGKKIKLSRETEQQEKKAKTGAKRKQQVIRRINKQIMNLLNLQNAKNLFQSYSYVVLQSNSSF